jgi:ABC-type multidrug transport system fused ATPase/permease subunit
MIDGVDVSKIGLHTLRSNMSIVSQQPVVFTGTIRSNLDPVGNKHSDAVLHDALRRVQLVGAASSTADSKIGDGGERRLTLDTELSSGGENLSSGERQLLTLARTILSSTKVVVMDEATSSVDSATDAKIQLAVASELGDRTVLTIAHRLDTVIDCDRIMVMDAGRVAEIGSPAELLANVGGHFARLVSETGEVQSNKLRKRIATKVSAETMSVM